MPETQNQTAFERAKELTDRLETGIQDLLQSEKYMEYLKSMSQFHRYSTRNTLLIHLQNPTATRVASFKAWDEKFNRHVKKGETGLRIFAPIKTKVKEEFDKIDPDTKAPMLDANGKVITEELESESLRFKLVPVFDVSQTYGDPLPEIVENLTDDVAQYEALLDTLKAVSPLPIEFEPLAENNDGYCEYGIKIGIREGMSEAQTVAAVVHEITHAKLHDKEKTPETADSKSKRVKEVEAESISYVVCQHYVIETSPNSFGYLAEWGSDDMSEFKASLDTIRKEASVLITDIDERFQAICKERGIDLTSKESEHTAVEVSVVPETTVEPSFTTEVRTETIAGMEFTATDIIPEKPEEDYEITYWNTGTEIEAIHYLDDDGAYETLAYISYDRSVEFADMDLSDEVKEKIISFSQTEDKGISVDDIPKNEILPDPTISIAERNSYGYTADDILPLRQDKALELFDADQTIYMIHPDGTETMVFERSEIEGYLDIFGIDREDWESTAEYAELKSQTSEAVKESAPTQSNIDTFAIYQLKDGDELRYHRFASINQLEKDNLVVDRDNYNLVYKAPLLTGETLDDIYSQFNHAHPKGFTGHSLSVSDVVVIQRDSETTSHYVDNTEFTELPAFLGNEKQPEQAALPEQQTEKPLVKPVVERRLSEMLGLNLEDRKAQPEQKPIEQAVYRESIPYAREHGELDRYTTDRNLNVECKDAIHTAINKSRYDTNFYKMKDAVKEVVDTYGAERVELILAKIVQGADWDGRYSRQNKEWAKGFDIPQSMKDVYSNTHPCLLDGFLDKVHEKPSVLETLKANAEKSRQQSEPKQDTKKSKEMEM